MDGVSQLRVAAVLTCHNRREKTVACLRALADQKLPGGVRIDVFLMDDGSSDGTSEAVRDVWPGVHLLHGDGSLFWCGGMRAAWREAQMADPDFYLLLNDDTHLFPSAVAELMEISPSPGSANVAVGAVGDPVTGKWTYGGLGKTREWSGEDAEPVECRTMNANCVLVPRLVCRETGIFYHAYTHAMGDIDYGFAARRNGFRLFETPCFVGTCSDNPVEGTWRDATLPRAMRLRKLLGPKGLPLSEWFHYTRRNSGIRWPLYFLSPYLRVALNK